MAELPKAPLPTVWALRKAWLPDYPAGTRDWMLRTWNGPHPSPEFSRHATVWYRGYTPSLDLLLQFWFVKHSPNIYDQLSTSSKVWEYLCKLPRFIGRQLRIPLGGSHD